MHASSGKPQLAASGSRETIAPMQLPAPIVPMAETSLIDENVVHLGEALDQLMTRAGMQVAQEAVQLCPEGDFLIVAGSGNNGGDGYVAARTLLEQGRDVSIWPVKAPKTPLAKQAAEACMRLQPRILHHAPTEAPSLIIDALLGCGQKGALDEHTVDALTQLRPLAKAVLAIDVPSGLMTRHMLPNCKTLCLQVAKSEMLARPDVGEFKTVDIGVPPSAYQDIHHTVLRQFPPLLQHGHKGQHGECLVIGGGMYPGALEFASSAALLTGCDLVRVITSDGPPLPPSIIQHRLPGKYLSAIDPDMLSSLLLRAGCMLIGPGLGREPGTSDMARQAFGICYDMGIPIVVDADGISALSHELQELPPGDTPVVITPHQGEARSLLGNAISQQALHQFARPDRVLMVKGVVDLITNGRRWQRNPRGNPRMAVGGTGDLLSGLTCGLIARGCNSFNAGRMALFWLCSAADELITEFGPCYNPEHIIERLPHTLRRHLRQLGMWPPIKP